jgi:hypothetical protein
LGIDARLLTRRTQTRSVQVFITHLRAGPRAMFERAGIFALLAPDALQPDVNGAMARIGR